MIKASLTFLVIIISSIVFSQIGDLRRAPCFSKAAERLGKKYVNWECKDGDNILDCNENLEVDQDSKLVITRETGNLFSGDCETCHDNGLRERLVRFDGGKVDGIDTTYYQSGCPQVVRNHLLGNENGRWTFYNDTSGMVAWHINYLNGEKHGQSIFYRQYKIGTEKYKITINNADRFLEYAIYQSDTFKIENYTNGILDGPKTDYYLDSRVKTEINYKAGLFDGAYIEYTYEGNVLQERFYEQGIKEGEWKYYYNDGNLLRTEIWKDDLKDGTFKTFYIQGDIQSLETYKNGMKHGDFIDRSPDNKLKRQAFYKKDELIENHVFDKYGNEIETFGGDESKNTSEDDEIPTIKSKKWWQFWKKE